MSNKVSTTKIARQRGLTNGLELFEDLKKHGFTKRDENNMWALTDIGLQIGGEYQLTDDDNKYIVWPENIVFPFESESNTTESLAILRYLCAST